MNAGLAARAHLLRQRSRGDLYLQVKQRTGAQRATLTTARKIARRAHHLLLEVEPSA